MFTKKILNGKLYFCAVSGSDTVDLATLSREIKKQQYELFLHFMLLIDKALL